MTDTDLYRQLPGLTAPWQISRVELNVAQQEVRVHVTYDFAQPHLLCPECGQAGPYYDLREERAWRHLDSCQFQTFLAARLPRIACPTHGVKTIAAPWCEPHSRFTLAFECFAIAVLTATGVQARAARLLRLSPTQVQELMARAVDRGLARRDRERDLPHLSLDEKSFQRGHHYITVLGDSLGRGVLDIVEGRTLEAAKSLLLNSLSLAQRAQVASVSMDMWPAFAGAKEQVLPKAQTVHDRFHIAFFWNWYEQARALGNKHLTKVAQMLCAHLPGLLAYLCHRTSNAVAEGLNAQMQLIKARARGFRRFAAFRIAILFFLGRLDLNPHKTR